MLAGAILIGWSMLAAIVVSIDPQPNALDRWGFEWVARSTQSTALLRITDLGSAAVFAIGSILAALVCIRRDRRRAAACVGGPLMCALLVEYVFKPLVGRHYLGVLSYPSGNVADLAALATAWVVAVPIRVRLLVALVGTVAVASMMVAVVGLRWHYPSDALGGAVLGVGTVLLVDGALHLRRGDPAAEGGARSHHDAR